MAWRPSACLIDGELDNTVPNKVTGWMRFAGMKRKVKFNLEGDFHRDIRGAKIRLTGAGENGSGYMKSFSSSQRGKVGDITAGLPPADYTVYPYIEWYSIINGRVCIELESDQIEVVGTPIPVIESDPIDRREQSRNMMTFLCGLLSQKG